MACASCFWDCWVSWALGSLRSHGIARPSGHASSQPWPLWNVPCTGGFCTRKANAVYRMFPGLMTSLHWHKLCRGAVMQGEFLRERKDKSHAAAGCFYVELRAKIMAIRAQACRHTLIAAGGWEEISPYVWDCIWDSVSPPLEKCTQRPGSPT